MSARRYRARVLVVPRREILDPQGKAIAAALSRIGFGEVAAVLAGRAFELELEAADPLAAEQRVRQMCEQLLANTIVEDYELLIKENPRGEA